MNKEQLKEICRQTAKRCILKQYKYQVLNRGRLSEAEVRNVMVRILEERKFYYGIEIATEENQEKEGNVINRPALVDLVIYDNRKAENPIMLIEFKRAQPSLYKIEKDFAKMMNEPARVKGSCFFHILPKEKKRAEKALGRARNEIVKKYYQAYSNVNIEKCVSKWFMLYILDASARKLYVCEKQNICHVDRFDDGTWEAIEYSHPVPPPAGD
mgnify:CR=1 FL=1